jgi:hypothetical protein
MEKVVKIYKLGEEPSDVFFWVNQPPIEIIKALEAIRKRYNDWKYGRDQRLQRVCKVVKRQSK